MDELAFRVEAIGDLPLESGVVLDSVEIAYTAFGRLAADGRNAVLVTHGFSSGPSMLLQKNSTAEGSWAALVGPGKPLDTDRFFIVCPNMLGSACGSTGPASIDARTGRPYGPEFPEITVGDMVASQWKLMSQLGVKHLRAVVGPSYGGILAQQWALDYPEMVGAIGVIVSGPRFPASSTVEGLQSHFSQYPQWKGGHYYASGGVREALKALRVRTLKTYSFDTLMQDVHGDKERAEAALDKAAKEWAASFDANALIVLLKAAKRFDAIKRYAEIRAQVLYVVSRTDPLFPPHPDTLALLDTLPEGRKQYRYLEIESRYGHLASGADHAKWSPALVELLHD